MPMIISEKLSQQVEEALREFLARSSKGNFVRLETLQVIERPFSIVVFFRAHTDSQPCDVVLKKVVHHPVNIALTKNKNQAEVEYSMLSSLFPYFQEERHCSVPQPIALFLDEEAYLMEHVSGTLLSDKITASRYFSAAKDFDALKNWHYLCGRWLRKFQEVTATEPVGVEIFSATLTRCEEKLDIIRDVHDPRSPAGLKELVMGNLDREIEIIGDEKVLTAGRHGDFGVWNILTNEDGITVFDFLGSQPDSVAIDVLKVLVSLEDEKKSLSCSGRKACELKKIFLAGYGPLPKIQRPVAVICETLHRVCSLSASVASTEGIGLRRKIVKHLCLKNHLSWLSTESDQRKLLWTEFSDQ